MEITSFVLGMLTIVAVIVLTVIVVGMVKINRLNKDLHTFKNNYIRDVEDIHRHIQDSNQEIWREFEKSGKDVTIVERTIMNQIDETRRYIDSRLDKLASKQVIKG